MWGNILTEVSYLNNFNMTFSNNKSDVLIHLTQWQYWWWFWFTFLWALYYLLTARIVRYRTLKFNPKIATTLRPHGKWGDLLTCIIPVTWCMNILLNSNFVLKLIEWQSESSLFTLRIRAKQWYWVYKFDLKNITDIFSTPKNLGRNKWYFSVFGDVQTSEDYLHILQLRAQNKWIKKYWNDLLDKTTKTKDFHVISLQDKYRVDFFQKKFELATHNNLDVRTYHASGNGYYDSYYNHRNFEDKALHDILIKRNQQGVTIVKDTPAVSYAYTNEQRLADDVKRIPVFMKEMRQALKKPIGRSPIFEFLSKVANNKESHLIIKMPAGNSFSKILMFRDGTIHPYEADPFAPVTKEELRNLRISFYTNCAWDAIDRRERLNPQPLTLGLFNISLWGRYLAVSENRLKAITFNNYQTTSSLNIKEIPAKRFFYQTTVYSKVLRNNPVDKYTHTFFNRDVKYFKRLNYNIINHSDFSDETRVLKKSTGKPLPIRCIKFPIQENNNPTELLRFRFNSSESLLQHKPITNTSYLTLKQKRYNVRSKINPVKLNTSTSSRKYNYSGNPFLKDFSIVEENFSTPTKQYRMFKKAKNRLETSSINTWNRLLRAKRVLVLPAHVNITAITNSYDIIHSWHIPGLGLKMDCLPGRATHHTFYIDNVGLYFGQCAEICGRYHHHMPVRVCALPFEHFLVWWYSFGLPRLLFLNEKNYKEYSFRKFSW